MCIILTKISIILYFPRDKLFFLVDKKPLDVVFVFGSSSRNTNGEKHKHISGKILERFNISPLKAHVGFVTYSNIEPRSELKLKDGTNYGFIISRLESMNIPKGERLSSALEYLHKFSFTENEGGRPSASRKAIIIIDDIEALQSEAVQKQMNVLKRAGVESMVVNVGDKPNNNNNNNSLTPYHLPDDEDSLDRLLKDIIATSNKGEPISYVKNFEVNMTVFQGNF